MATDAPSSLKIIDVHTCIYNQPHLQLLVVKYPKHHYRMAATSKWIYKYLSLVILILQNTLLVLVMRYSRTVTVDGLRYLPSTAVVMSELLKLLTCFIMVCYGVQWNTIRAISQLHTEIVRNGREMFKLSVPAILYTIQNNLLYIALTYLDAATFQVTYQLKILTTAIFSVIILRRSLSVSKWISLVILTIAVALVQLSKVEESSSPDDGSSSGISLTAAGLMVVVCASITSGVAGVYTEKILKGSDTSIWIRNIQLALFSIVISMVGVFVSDWTAVMELGFFQGYSPIVFAAIALQALGGIVVAAVMKYADNILKGFAAALSVVLSSITSYFLLSDFYPSMSFLLGVVLLLASTALYNWPQTTSQHQSSLPLYTVTPPKSL